MCMWQQVFLCTSFPCYSTKYRIAGNFRNVKYSKNSKITVFSKIVHSGFEVTIKESIARYIEMIFASARMHSLLLISVSYRLNVL